MWWFLPGLLIGTLLVWPLVRASRRRSECLDEEKHLLAQEKQIVVEFMHNLADAVSEGEGREALFRRVVKAAILSTGALSACVFERTAEGTYRGVVSEGLFPPLEPLPPEFQKPTASRTRMIEQILKSEEFAEGAGLVGQIGADGEALLIADAREDDRIPRHEDPALRVRSLILAPIRFRGQCMGVLGVANPADGQAFNETDFSLMTSLAEQAALAVHNMDAMQLLVEKSKIDVELSLASNIQSMLLPKRDPANDRVDLDACYQPARKVGGDLYDHFDLPGGRLGVAIADVSGKGIPASLLMALCQSNLRHLARQHDSPASVLRALNEAVIEEINQDMFITVIYGIVDTQAGTVTLARAGHELPILVRKDADADRAEVLFVRGEGMAVGMMPGDVFDEAIEDCTFTMGRDDLLVLFTDGVTETRNPEGQEFSAERLAEVVCEAYGRSARDVNGAVIDSLNQFSGNGGTTSDDLTLLTVRTL